MRAFTLSEAVELVELYRRLAEHDRDPIDDSAARAAVDDLTPANLGAAFAPPLSHSTPLQP